jgi:hypothetical protein
MAEAADPVKALPQSNLAKSCNAYRSCPHYSFYVLPGIQKVDFESNSSREKSKLCQRNFGRE